MVYNAILERFLLWSYLIIKIKNISHMLLLNDLIKISKQINLKTYKYYEV